MSTPEQTTATTNLVAFTANLIRNKNNLTAKQIIDKLKEFQERTAELDAAFNLNLSSQFIFNWLKTILTSKTLNNDLLNTRLKNLYNDLTKVGTEEHKWLTQGINDAQVKIYYCEATQAVRETIAHFVGIVAENNTALKTPPVSPAYSKIFTPAPRAPESVPAFVEPKVTTTGLQPNASLVLSH